MLLVVAPAWAGAVGAALLLVYTPVGLQIVRSGNDCRCFGARLAARRWWTFLLRNALVAGSLLSLVAWW